MSTPNVSMPDYEGIFNASFRRVTHGDDFFLHFYETFAGRSQEIADKFQGADMAGLGDLVALQLIHMVAFFGRGQASPELQRIAGDHSKAKRNIEPRLYDEWLESLIATAREHDAEWSESVESAWRTVLAPGIAYMKAHYDP